MWPRQTDLIVGMPIMELIWTSLLVAKSPVRCHQVALDWFAGKKRRGRYICALMLRSRRVADMKATELAKCRATVTASTDYITVTAMAAAVKSIDIAVETRSGLPQHDH